MSKQKASNPVRVPVKTFFTERSQDFFGGPGYTGAPSLHQGPGSAANRRLIRSGRRSRPRNSDIRAAA